MSSILSFTSRPAYLLYNSLGGVSGISRLWFSFDPIFNNRTNVIPSYSAGVAVIHAFHFREQRQKLIEVQ